VLRVVPSRCPANINLITRIIFFLYSTWFASPFTKKPNATLSHMGMQVKRCYQYDRLACSYYEYMTAIKRVQLSGPRRTPEFKISGGFASTTT